MLLSGPPGIGKTTVAKLLCHQLGVDYYVINGSDEGRFLDTVRNNAKNFASTVSLSSTAKHKVIIIDEFLITQQTTYNSYLGRLLRSFMATADSSSPATTKTKSSNHFIPVAQWLSSELEENKNLQSRPSSSNDSKTSSTPKELSMTTKSLSNSSTNTSQIGRVLNECQRYAVGGKIDTGILTTFKEVAVNEYQSAFVKNLKEKNFSEVRKWCVNRNVSGQ